MTGKETELYHRALSVLKQLSENLRHFVYLPYPKLCEQAQTYLRYGVGERLNYIHQDFKYLIENTPIDQKEPLTLTQCRNASRHLNSMYLHIRGALDNFAWALIWQLNPEEAQIIEKNGKHTKVGLFRNDFKGYLSNYPELISIIDSARDWNKEFARKRDPVAHRLPLKIPPYTIIGIEKINDYRQILEQKAQQDKEYRERLANEKPLDGTIEEINNRLEEWEQIDNKFKTSSEELDQKAESLGSFEPVFYSKDTISLYPTVVDDCDWLLKISTEFITILKNEYAI